jgi:hypothetical protein
MTTTCTIFGDFLHHFDLFKRSERDWISFSSVFFGIMPAPCDSTSPSLPTWESPWPSPANPFTIYEVTHLKQQIGPWLVRAHDLYNYEYDDIGSIQSFPIFPVRLLRVELL